MTNWKNSPEQQLYEHDVFDVGNVLEFIAVFLSRFRCLSYDNDVCRVCTSYCTIVQEGWLKIKLLRNHFLNFLQLILRYSHIDMLSFAVLFPLNYCC